MKDEEYYNIQRWSNDPFFYLFIYLNFFFFLNSGFFCVCFFLFFLWLCWVFVSVRGLSLVAASGGHSSPQRAGLSLSRPLLLRSTGSRRAGSVVVAHGPSCSAACGIFPDQGSNPCPCIGRQTLNHCATREAQTLSFKYYTRQLSSVENPSRTGGPDESPLPHHSLPHISQFRFISTLRAGLF